MLRFRPSLFLTLLLVGTVPVQAHRLSVFVYPEGDRVHVESFFNRGAACRGCRVEVTDSAGERVASGTTSEQGEWSFVPPGRRGLTVSVTASEGHRAEYELTETDYPDSLDLSASQVATPEAAEENLPPATGKARGDSSALSVSSTEELESLFDRVLERKLAPIRQDLKRLQVREPGLSEIMGGIGYLFGLCGVAMYFLSRRKGS